MGSTAFQVNGDSRFIGLTTAANVFGGALTALGSYNIENVSSGVIRASSVGIGTTNPVQSFQVEAELQLYLQSLVLVRSVSEPHHQPLIYRLMGTPSSRLILKLSVLLLLYLVLLRLTCLTHNRSSVLQPVQLRSSPYPIHHLVLLRSLSD